MRKKILVVEDDKRVNEIVCDYLEAKGYKICKAYDGAEALRIFDTQKFDLVILDIMMPGMDGFTVCKKIRSKSDALIIFLTARADEDDKLMGFEFGADEYVTKPFSPKVLVARVNALLKRNSANTQTSVIEKGSLYIDKESYLVKSDGAEVVLTAKEYELLFLLADNEGRVLKRESLINNIWGYNYFGDGRVLDTNIKTLRKKLGLCANYIHTVIGIGYKFEVKS